MNENKSAEQRNLGPKIISLGEEIRPFDSAGISALLFNRPMIILNIEKKAKISFSIGCAFSRTQKIDAVTPFDPEVGYQIDFRDLKLETRMLKLKQLRKDLERQIEYEKAPYFLTIDAGMTREINAGQVDEEDTNSEFSTEMLEIIRKLRVLVSFPEGKYEAKPKEITLRDNSIWFNDFYPIDTGPLPSSGSLVDHLSEGFGLFLPKDSEKLAQIRMKFVLAPGESSRGGEN